MNPHEQNEVIDPIRARLDVKIKPYIEDEAARSVAVGLVATFRTMEKMYGTDEVTPELRAAVLRMLVDLTYDFPSNPFWLQHAGYIMPVYATALNAWLDMPAYSQLIGNGASDAAKEAILRAEAMRTASVEVANAVLYKAVGAAAARKMVRHLRDALLDM